MTFQSTDRVVPLAVNLCGRMLSVKLMRCLRDWSLDIGDWPGTAAAAWVACICGLTGSGRLLCRCRRRLFPAGIDDDDDDTSDNFITDCCCYCCCYCWGTGDQWREDEWGVMGGVGGQAADSSFCRDLLAAGISIWQQTTDRLAQTPVCKAAVRPMREFVGCFGH